ncbi:MAG: hypothetical protein R3F34_14870 [Planctomycetota bacterium]
MTRAQSRLDPALIDDALVSGAPRIALVERGAGVPLAAVAAVPLPADGPRGVLWLEFDHALVPVDRRLRTFAAAALLRCLHRVDVDGDGPDALVPRVAEPRARFDTGAPASVRADGAQLRSDDPRALVARELVARTPFANTASTHWFVVRCGSEWETWATNARGAPSVPRDGVLGRGIERCLTDGEPRVLGDLAGCESRPRVEVDDLPEHVRLERDASARVASAAFVPIVCEHVAPPRTIAVLVVASPRRHQFGASAAARASARVGRAGLDVERARFAAWHANRFGEPVEPAALALADHAALFAAARARTVGVVGANGSGRTRTCRWLHMLAGGDGPFETIEAGRGLDWSAVRRVLDDASGGSLVLRRVERADVDFQLELVAALERLETGGAPLRLLWVPTTARATSSRARARAAVRLLGVDALRERFPAIVPALVRCCARSSASAPRLSDAALGALWRHPWPRGVEELVGVCRELARTAATGDIGLPAVERAARARGITLPERLSSRGAVRAPLVAALRATRLENGRTNQRRAAVLLGWDRDTVRARMREFGLSSDAT